MSKQLIVVVHGVGVREAGVSAELLSAALQMNDDQASTPAPRIPPHSSDDFHLTEDPIYDRNAKASTFPAHVRRFREYDDSDARLRNERLIADFFWGDIAAVSGGVLGAVSAFFRIAMGLGHAIRENARDVFPHATAEDRLMRCLASQAVLTIHGPIIAINLVLLIGVLVSWIAMHLVEPYTIDADLRLRLEMVAMVGISSGLGYLLSLWSRVYLTRHLAGWLVFSAVVLGGMYLYSPATTIHAGSWDDRLAYYGCAVFGGADRYADCRAELSGIYLHGLRIYAVMILFWALFLILALVVAMGSVWRWYRGRRGAVVDLIAPALGLMALLWFLFVSAIWSMLGGSGLDMIPVEYLVVSSLRGAFPVMVAVVLLVAVALFVAWRKRELKAPGYDPQSYLRDADLLAERYRLLMSPYMLVVLFGFLITLGWLIVHALLPACSVADGPWVCQLTSSLLTDWTPFVLVTVGSAAALLVVSLREQFAAGLDILADVIAYLNDYSWHSVERPCRSHPDASSSQADRAQRRGYWLRTRIQNRMRVLMDTLLQDERPDQVVIVAHSQGTVIALDVLEQNGARWLAQLPRGGEIRLITMGSPARHLYGHYFPTAFPAYPRRPALRPRGTTAEAALSRWVNIFRVDDFVGTHIAEIAENWPVEIPVPANGHTMYWVDRSVAVHLRRELDFTRPPSDLPEATDRRRGKPA